MINMKIPKIFHQLWFDFGEGNGVEFPEKFKSYRDSWSQLHPDWEYKLWNQEDFLKILPENLHGIYYKYDKMIKKVDFAKYVILCVCGGFYIDTDEECFKNIEQLVCEYDVILAFDYQIEKFEPNMSIINSFMACVPNHPLFVYVINCCPQYQNYWVCKSTGPTFFGQRVYEYFNDNNGSEILKNIKIYMDDDYKLFYPISWNSPDQIKKYRHNREQFIKDYPNAYKTSHWSNLWENNKLIDF